MFSLCENNNSHEIRSVIRNEFEGSVELFHVVLEWEGEYIDSVARVVVFSDC